MAEDRPSINSSGSVRSIRIAVLAMGGEGGGVLANWLIHMARSNGYTSQMTSVPGVAQRTGATIYYIEMFPVAQIPVGQHPVLALMPVPGDVDIVLASELMEAGRAIQRGIVTPDRTSLIASSHRVYAMTERVAMADGRVDEHALLSACRTAARRFIAFDMMQLAEKNGSVISAVLFGALAGAGVLPFDRLAFERTIEASGVGVKASLLAFKAGFEHATGAMDPKPLKANEIPLPVYSQTISGIGLADYPEDAVKFIQAGFEQCEDWQDKAYANLYLERLKPIADFDKALGGQDARLLQEMARQLALSMCYEDTIRVADLKIRSSRFSRVADEIGIKHNQILEIREFLHPRRQEILETLPGFIGRILSRSKFFIHIIDRLTQEGRIIETTSIRGFLLLYCVANLRKWRRSTERYMHEQKHIETWLDFVLKTAQIDYELAIEVAELRGSIKGYGDTHANSLRHYELIYQIIPFLVGPEKCERVKALRKAAQIDDAGKTLNVLLAEYLSHQKN